MHEKVILLISNDKIIILETTQNMNSLQLIVHQIGAHVIKCNDRHTCKLSDRSVITNCNHIKQLWSYYKLKYVEQSIYLSVIIY